MCIKFEIMTQTTSHYTPVHCYNIKRIPYNKLTFSPASCKNTREYYFS